MVEQLESHSARCAARRRIGERITGIEIKGRCEVLLTGSGAEIHARAVIQAAGATKTKLGVPGEEELNGRGVVYCDTWAAPCSRTGASRSAAEAAQPWRPPSICSKPTSEERSGYTALRTPA